MTTRFRTGRRRVAALTTALALAVVGALASAPAATAGPDDSHTFDAWSSAYSGGVDVTFAADQEVVHDGTASLRIENATPKAPNKYAQFLQGVDVEPDTTYQFSVWAKTDGLPATSALYAALDPTWVQRFTFPSGSYDWQQLTWSVTTSATASSYTVRLISQDAAIVWLDDFSMVAEGTTENLLQNPGFEANTAPTAALGVANSDLMFDEGDVAIEIASDLADVSWAVTTIDGQTLDSGTVTTVDDAATLEFDDYGPGYYGLRLSVDTPDGPVVRTTSFGVFTADEPRERLADHPFAVSHHISQIPASAIVGATEPLGIGDLRFDLAWTSVEKSAGVYTFDSDFDAKVDSLVDIGVRPLIILNYRNPLYDDNKTPSTPEGIAAFAAYAGAAAAHYGDAVDFEVYNEFNHAGFNDGLCGRTPECYVELLAPTSDAIHAAAPGARVVGPALAGPDEAWMEGFFAAGGLDHVDIVSLHSYDWPNAPEGRTEATIADLRAAMIEIGGQEKPLWWTEHGWPTPVGGNTERQQADFIPRGFLLMNVAGVQKTFVYDFVATANPTEALYNYGIIRDVQSGITAFAPKPAYVAYGVMNNLLAGTRFAEREEVADGVHVYRYETPDGHAVRVAWALQPTVVRVAGSGEFELVDQFGETYPVGAGGIEVTLGDGPVYITGDAAGAVTLADEPTYGLTVPAQLAEGTPVDLGVSVAGGADRTVSFTDPTGASVDLAVAGGSATGTLTVPAFPSGTHPRVTVVAREGDTTVALLREGATAVENPVVQLLPDTEPDGSTSASVRLTNVATQAITVDTVDWSIGEASGAVEVGAEVPAGATIDVDIPAEGQPQWTPLASRIDVAIVDGPTRSVTGSTAFAGIGPDAPDEVSELASDGRYVELGGTLGGADDLSGTMWLTGDDTAVTVHAEIVDDEHSPGPQPAELWRGDSIQFSFSSGLPGSSSNRSEIGAALLANGQTTVYGFATPSGEITAADATIVRDDEAATTSYEVTVPWSTLGLDPSDPYVAYSFLVNDNEDGVRKGWYEWGSGIGQTKNILQFLPIQRIGVDVPEPGTPVATEAPSVSGTPRVGQTLTADPGEWDADGLAFAYQWQADGEDIAGATGSSYTVGSGDQGKVIGVVVTATRSDLPPGSAVSEGVTVLWESDLSVAMSRYILFSWQRTTATVRVTSAAGDPPAGEVTLDVNGRTLTAPVVGGVATVPLPRLGAGLYLVRASYQGDDATADSSAFTLFWVVI